MSTLKQIKQYDTIIDARSPAEYAEDHIPGAINLPAFSNSERAAVGTLYKKDPFAARRYGAMLFSANVAKHLDNTLADQPPDWAPLVYCARGGQRSGGMVEIMQRIGWQATKLAGGYKTYRQHVMHTIAQGAQQYRWVTIAGKTGVGKTRLLKTLRQVGAQVIDLEQYANHRGSVFGNAGAQPAQRRFESLICAAMENLTVDAPVFVEAESRKIGALHVPAQLLLAMRNAPAMRVEAPIGARVAYILSDYRAFCQDRARFAATIEKLKIYAGAARIAVWQAQYDSGKWQPLVSELLQGFYDIGYEKSLRTNYTHAYHDDALCTDPNDEKQLLKTARAIVARADT